MALILTEGFDIYRGLSTQSSAYKNMPPDVRWGRVGSVSDYSYIKVDSGRRGGHALGLGPNSTSAVGNSTVRVNLGAEYSTLIVGFAWKPSSLTTMAVTYPTFYFMDALVAYQLGIQVNYDHTWTLLTGSIATGDIITTSPNPVTRFNTWQFVEIKIVCHGSSGSLTVQVDGIQVWQITGLNTRNAGAGGMQIVGFSSIATSVNPNTFVDDLYILDTTGTTFNDFLGDIAIDGHLFTADGSDGDWDNSAAPAAHFDSINVVGQYYASNYLEGDTVGKKDSFTITPTEYAEGILGVEVAAHGTNDTGGTAKIRPYCTIGGTRYYGDASQMSAGTTDKTSYLWRLNPATGGFWTNAVLATTEFGFDVTEIT